MTERVYIFLNDDGQEEALHFVRSNSYYSAQCRNNRLVESLLGKIKATRFMGEYSLDELQFVVGINRHTCQTNRIGNYEQLAQLLSDNGYHVVKKSEQKTEY